MQLLDLTSHGGKIMFHQNLWCFSSFGLSLSTLSFTTSEVEGNHSQDNEDKLYQMISQYHIVCDAMACSVGQ